LGLTLRDLARQVRQGFYGEEAQRIQRGRDDIKVMVRYPEAERRSLGDVERMRIRLEDGAEVPFATVATVREGRGFATIARADRRRVVTVTAGVDEAVANANEVNASLQADALPELAGEFPGLAYSFEGEEKEKQESLGSLRKNFAVALLGIFALLAIPFRSYSQPLIVMSVIPFGFVGAVAGHLLMGLDLSLLSFFGMVALTGVVVNDSLIMIDLINRERREGLPLAVAIRDCGKRRFRPILLTTLTTFFGLTPMILETSLQAKFLIPMAVSLGFGVVFATAITLLLVPVIYMILEDFHRVLGTSAARRRREAAEGAEPSPA
jgi:multidrug efflux pump subunit AcrB